MRLINKVVAITGGNSGIGFGIAKKFQEEGAKGIILGRNEKSLNLAQETLGLNFTTFRGDVTIMEDLDGFFKNIQTKYGKIDVLVVNAGGGIGINSATSIKEVKEAIFDGMVDLNFKSSYFTVQKSISFLNDGASIILIGSIAAHTGSPGWSVYSACKAAIRSLARTLSAELINRNIRVNVLSPGPIDTSAFSNMGFSKNEVTEIKKQFTEMIPLKRMGTPNDMGSIALFLASSDSSFVVGEEIIADGGLVNL